MSSPNHQRFFAAPSKFESTRPQKAVITAGRYEFYHGISDTAPYQTGTVEIQAKWTDSEGNIWYKTFDTVTGGIWKGIRSQGLYKLSKSGTVLEKQFNRIGGGDFGPNNYPPKIDPKSDYPYTILYRSAN